MLIISFDIERAKATEILNASSLCYLSRSLWLQNRKPRVATHNLQAASLNLYNSELEELSLDHRGSVTTSLAQFYPVGQKLHNCFSTAVCEHRDLPSSCSAQTCIG